jgi:hypothetical protein
MERSDCFDEFSPQQRTNVLTGINNGRVESTNAMMTASGRGAEAGAINVTLTMK